MKYYDQTAFYIPEAEIAAVMKRGELHTVTEAVRLLVPDYAFYKCTKGGYWGRRRRTPRGGVGTPVVLAHPRRERRLSCSALA